MEDVVLPKIQWLGIMFVEGGMVLTEINPPEKIHIGHVTQFCRHGIKGSAEEQLEKYKALQEQYGHMMERDALEYLKNEIAALEHHAKA